MEDTKAKTGISKMGVLSLILSVSLGVSSYISYSAISEKNKLSQDYLSLKGLLSEIVSLNPGNVDRPDVISPLINDSVLQKNDLENIKSYYNDILAENKKLQEQEQVNSYQKLSNILIDRIQQDVKYELQNFEKTMQEDISLSSEKAESSDTNSNTDSLNNASSQDLIKKRLHCKTEYYDKSNALASVENQTPENKVDALFLMQKYTICVNEVNQK